MAENIATAIVLLAFTAFLIWAVMFGPVGSGAAPGAW
jgi:hypothetical protein